MKTRIMPPQPAAVTSWQRGLVKLLRQLGDFDMATRLEQDANDWEAGRHTLWVRENYQYKG